jgi:fructokinase
VRKKTVLAFGETLWDLLPSGPALGGAPCNVAYRVNATGGRGRIATRLGTDDLGRRAAESLARLGLETDLVQWDAEKPTGTVPVTVDAQGVPDFEIRPDVAYDRIEAAPALLEAARTADAVVYGTLVQRTAGSRETLGRLLEAAGQAVKFCDLNLRKGCYTRDTVGDALKRADILKLNEGEARELAGMFGIPGQTGRVLIGQLAKGAGLDAVVITLGAKGVVAQKGDQWLYAPAFEAEVVDTCGSGDAFSAGFLRAWLEGWPLPQCCRWGNAFGAIVAGQAGATAPFPDDWSDRANAFRPAPAWGDDVAYWVS